MSNVKVNLLGHFMTTINNKRITFPYGKAEALFYYLVVNKSASRDHLANLLWSDMEDRTAKKNLRNALYTLRKLFKEDIFISHGLSTISLNQDLIYKCDYDTFIKNEDNTDIYKGMFLKGYTVRDADEFDRWMHKIREECNYIYVNRLWEKAVKYKEAKDYVRLENICRRIIEIDEYDEKGYIELMNCLKEQQRYSSAIEVYHDLADLLQKELEVIPNTVTQKVYNEILDLMNKREAAAYTSELFFFGRDKETRLLKSNYHSFIQNKPHKSILVKGEIGVGKAGLIEHFMDQIVEDKVNVVDTPCYKFEETYVLRPWKAILIGILKIIKREQIKISPAFLDVLVNIAPEFEGQRDEIVMNKRPTNEVNYIFEIDDVILELLKVVSDKNKLVIIFEDIHWMDATSMRLFNSILVQDELDNCLFIFSMSNEMNSELERFLIYANNYANVDVIELESFTKTEVGRFIERALPKEKISAGLFDEIYKETEGNPFFLTEYIWAVNNNQTKDLMTTRIKDALKFRFMDLNEKEKTFVEITSLFYKDISISFLKELMDLSDLEIVEVAESLVKKGLLKETMCNNDICYKFVHHKLREFQYNSISKGKKVVLHNRVGDVLQTRLHHNLNDLDIYYRLIYHYERSGNGIELLHFRIKSMRMFFDFIHERFPKVNFDNKAFSKFYIGEENTERDLKELVDLLESVKEEYPANKGLSEFEMDVYYLHGRYKIRRGKYESGLLDIDKVIRLAIMRDDLDFILKGYEQRIIYSYQAYNIQFMKQELTNVQKYIDRLTDQSEVAIWIFYQGIYKYLRKEYKKAEELFLGSIRIHMRDEETYEKYRLRIAACNNFIGEIRVKQEDYGKALQYFEKAITICEQGNLWISVSLFETNAGVACYYLNDFENAEKHLQSALIIYNKLAYNMSQSIAEVYMCLLLIRKKDYDRALHYLKESDKHAKLNSPNELRGIHNAKKLIMNNMGTNKELEKVFKVYLKKYSSVELGDNRVVY